MPTFKITDKQTGRRVGGNIIADTSSCALHEMMDDPVTGKEIDDEAREAAVMSDRYLVEKVSDQPEARVYTVLRQDHEDPGKVWEVMTTGSRDEGIGEVGRGQARGQVRSLVEETGEVNRVMAKGRRS